MASGLPREREITVVTGYGRGPKHCYGTWSSGETASGQWVEVLARKTVDGGYAICFEERDYISVPTAVPDAYDRSVVFRGTIVEVINGCPADGWCGVRVSVEQVVKGDVAVRSVEDVVEICGLCLMECRGKGVVMTKGGVVLVTAERRDYGWLSICPDATLGVRLLATATPWCGYSGCPPTTPPTKP